MGLATGKDYLSSSHIDADMTYTMTGSFSTGAGKVGNSFVFPEFQAKIVFPNDEQNVKLFCFNPKYLHCAEKVEMVTGHSYLFSIYTKVFFWNNKNKNIKHF